MDVFYYWKDYKGGIKNGMCSDLRLKTFQPAFLRGEPAITANDKMELGAKCNGSRLKPVGLAFDAVLGSK